MYNASNDNGDGASAFSTLEPSFNPTIVETAQEGGSDDGDEWSGRQWPEGTGHVDSAQTNLNARLSDAQDVASAMYDARLQDFVIDMKDPGRADFVIPVGALGNASGTPLDGSQNMSFGESTVDGNHAVDGNNDNEGMNVYSGSDSSTSYNTPSGYDLSDPEVIGDLMSRRSVVDPRSPAASIQQGSTMRFNEQVMVTEYAPNTVSTHGGITATSTGNLAQGSPSPYLPGSDTLRQHANTNTGGSMGSNGSPNSNGSNRNSNDSNENNNNGGGTRDGSGPQGSDPDGNPLDKLVFTYNAQGGPLQHWGIEGTIRVADVSHFTGPSEPQNPTPWLRCKKILVRPEIIDRVTGKVHFDYLHNDRNRIRAIINGMSLFVLTNPNTRVTADNVTMLEDCVESTQEMGRILIRHLTHAETLTPDRLPLEVPILLYAERMHTHPCAVTGSFEHVKKVDDAGAVEIPYGFDDRGAQLVDPTVMHPPVIPSVAAMPTAPGSATSSAPVPGDVHDANRALIQGVLAAIQAMTQAHVMSDQRNASMTQQQARLQAATMRSNAQQLAHLTNHLGNLGHEVGRAIASHPTRHNHTIQATLSHPNAMPGQSNNPLDLGSLTQTIPVSLSIPMFDYGPYVQAFQPQPNDKNARHIDEATHQIVQRHLPPTVKVCYDAAHTSGVVLPVNDYVRGFQFVVESAPGKAHRIVHRYYWHSTFGTGSVTSSGFMLQPNIQERDFDRYAPSLKSLDPSSVRMFYIDLCRVAHDSGIYMPAYEEFRPEVTFSKIACGDTPTDNVPKFCQSQVPRWEAIIHHHLKRDKVIPSTHPQIAEIKHNPNRCEALMLLVSPCHPSYTTNGVLIQSHPQQGRRTLEEHFHRCEFYYYSQRCYLSTTHNWKDEIHIIHFLDSCLHSNVLRMLYNQEKYVPALQYKFTCEHIVAALKEYIASPSFVLLGGRHAVTPTTISTSTGTTLAAARPSGTTRYCFSRPNGGGGTQRSGNTGCSPRDRNVRTIKASAEPSLLDDDSSIAPPEDMIVAKLNGECLGGCDKFHPPYKCPNLTGDVEHQKKTFASLSSKRRYLPVRVITATKDDDDDVDLIDLHDPEDQDSDADQDFP